jgi:hypothetical protein
LEIIDYKVGTKGDVPTPHELAGDLDSFLAFLLVWRRYMDDPRVRSVSTTIVNLISLGSVTHRYDQRSIIQHRQGLSSLVETAMQGSLTPRPNPGCPWCPFREHCPAHSGLDLEDLDRYNEWQQRSEQVSSMAGEGK